MPITLCKHKSRIITFYDADDKNVPQAVFTDIDNEQYDFHPVYPVPFRKDSFKIIKKYADVYWIGGDKGLFRYCESEKNIYDKVMYFSADRDLTDNQVSALFGNENEIWVKTESGISHIELKCISSEEKAVMLRNETLSIVDRKGMISHRFLKNARDIKNPEKFNSCDNDGGFTASFCIGEILRYATLKREKGENHPETADSKKAALRALDACLLLMYITGRGDGFVSRSYHTTDAPFPDDGLFMHRQGDSAILLDTSAARSRGLSGTVCKMPYPEIPLRLRYLYENDGYTADDIIFKVDTSSDEVTLHLVNLYYAHLFLADGDSELDEMIKKNTALIVNHILDNNYEYVDFHGGATSWAKWSNRYFETPLGWGDGPLNSAELLMYIKLAESVCGKTEKWTNAYNTLLKEGYADLSVLHYDRAFAASIFKQCDPCEDIMYGDHMLANLTFFMLNMLEKDEDLKALYREGWQSWRQTSIGMEHQPVYDIPYICVYGNDNFISEDKIKMYFYRHNCSMLASGVSIKERADVATKEYRAGYRQTSYLLPPDERYISKYDRDPLDYRSEDSGGKMCVEMCSAYTFGYWMGRYYGILKEEEE